MMDHVIVSETSKSISSIDMMLAENYHISSDYKNKNLTRLNLK